MDAFIERFLGIKARFEKQPRRDRSLVCKTGFYCNCPVLKLQKAAWTNDDMESLRNQTGIFFSIWLDAESFKRQRVKYNIHALKLRKLAAYKLTSIDFATQFRKRFSPMQSDWPNVRVDFGPLTLMQGWIPIIEKTLDRDLLALMKRFAALSPMLDDLLAGSKKAKPLGG